MMLRKDLQYIADWIPAGSRVLDLGCGDGTLLHYLAQQKQTQGYGVEIDIDNIIRCTALGVNVIQADMEAGLSAFESQSFDVVVLSLTIQAMYNVEGIIEEMLRVGKTGIVTFPNFGYWENRRQLLWGRMPVSETIPYEWYNTPNIHFCTINNFAQFLAERYIDIQDQIVLHKEKRINWLPNLLGSLALVRFARADKYKEQS